ncbi:YdcF family protein, partial [Salmonella enterica]
DIANQFWHIPAEKIWLEDRSTNCGENARFSCALIRQAKENINTAIVVQDPTMQRRTIAAFRRVTNDDTDAPRWLSFPGFVPVLRHLNGGTHFANVEEGIWTVERYLSLIAGELPRLRDDETGYGPRGKDFIIHVDIPRDIENAWQVLQADTTLRSALEQRALR